MFAAVEITESISADMVAQFPGGQGSVSGTRNGPSGGTVSFQGEITDAHDGWVEETFDHYAYVPTGSTQVLTVSGSLIIEIAGGEASLGFDGYSVSGLGVNLTYTGHASQNIVGPGNVNSPPPTLTTTLNLGIQDNAAGIDYEFLNFTVTTTGQPNNEGQPIDRTFSGRAYDSTVGYVDVATTGTVYYSGDPSILLPLNGADIRLTSGTANALSVGALNTYFFSVGLGPGPHAAPTSWARYNWSDFTPDVIPSTDGVSPIALAVVTTYPGTQIPVTVDGRFSHSPAGAYLTFHWKLLHAPPGSHAVIDSPTQGQITITPDVTGDYLLRVTVSDGARQASDDVVVSIPSQNAPTLVSPQSGPAAGADQTAHVGDIVRLDGRASSSIFTNTGDVTYCWTLVVPAGSTATLTDSTASAPSFVPDIPGYYHAVLLSGPSCAGNGTEPVNLGPGSSTLTVTVDEPITFDPPLALDATLNPFGQQSFAVGKIDASGALAILVGSADDDLHVYRAPGGRTLAAASSLSGTMGETFALGDLNGDGFTDIVTGGPGTVHTFLQQAGGTFKASQTLVFESDSNLITAPLAVTHLYGSSGVSVAALDSLSRLYDIPADSAGVLGTPSYTTLPNGAGDNAIVFADLNNDGLEDAIIYTFGVGGAQIWTATSASAFTNTISVFGAGAADLYGDGKTEAIEATNSDVTIEPETSAGTAVTVSGTLADPQAVAAGDLAGRGRQDIVLVHDAELGGDDCVCGIGMLFQQPDTSFASEVFFPLDGSPSGPLWIGDLDGDGFTDLVYVIGGKVYIQYGRHP